jgi:hypothetical protein
MPLNGPQILHICHMLLLTFVSPDSVGCSTCLPALRPSEITGSHEQTNLNIRTYHTYRENGQQSVCKMRAWWRYRWLYLCRSWQYFTETKYLNALTWFHTSRIKFVESTYSTFLLAFNAFPSSTLAFVSHQLSSHYICMTIDKYNRGITFLLWGNRKKSNELWHLQNWLLSHLYLLLCVTLSAMWLSLQTFVWAEKLYSCMGT